LTRLKQGNNIRYMKPLKVFKDHIIKQFWNGSDIVPRGLLGMSEYFRHNTGIHFNFHQEDGYIVAISDNFRFGSIVTQAKNRQELDAKVKDAILTAFEVPSSSKKEANIRAVGQEAKEYVLA
jgi:hypothetical protein